MPRTWTRWTPEHAAGVLRELDASGLTLAQFARRRGLCVQRLRRWRDRLVVPPTVGPRLVELVPAVTAPHDERVGSIRLHCPTGHVVELDDVDLAHGVLTVLRALAEAAC